MRKHLLALILLLGAITGCALPTRLAELKNTYLLDVPATATVLSRWPAPLRLRSSRAPLSLADKSLVYRLSRVRYERDCFNTFLVSPSEQIDGILQQRWVLVSSSDTEDKHWVLQPTLEELWGDFSDPNHAQARVQLHFQLTEIPSQMRSERVILSERFQASIDLPADPRAEDVVDGLSACLERVLEAFENRVNDLPATETSGQSPSL